MPQTEWGWQITPEELRSWIIEDRPDLIVVNKPGLVVCHPSKKGPWSSLIGACRELLGVDRLHMPFRLDRETSGVVLMVKDPAVASRIQKAVQERLVQKEYLAVLHGRLEKARLVDAPIGREGNDVFATRQWVRGDGQPAVTEFEPVSVSDRFTLVRVLPRTGRLHQIRVHAAWMGHPIVGDKLYPDPRWMAQFVREGMNAEMRAAMLIDRQALHCSHATVDGESFYAPMPSDMAIM